MSADAHAFRLSQNRQGVADRIANLGRRYPGSSSPLSATAAPRPSLRLLGVCWRHAGEASPRSRRAAAARPSTPRRGSRSCCAASSPPRPRTCSSGSRPPTTPSSTSSTTSARSSSRSTSFRRSSTIPRSSAGSPRRTRSTTSSRWAACRCSRSRSPPSPRACRTRRSRRSSAPPTSRCAAPAAILAGGHTLRDDEPKYGLAVVGTVHPEGFWPKSGARPGDALFLTKPLGTGMLLHAAREGRRHEEGLAAATAAMTTLNRDAADALRPFSPQRCHRRHRLRPARPRARDGRTERRPARARRRGAAALPGRARAGGGRDPDGRRPPQPRVRGTRTSSRTASPRRRSRSPTTRRRRAGCSSRCRRTRARCCRPSSRRGSSSCAGSDGSSRAPASRCADRGGRARRLRRRQGGRSARDGSAALRRRAGDSRRRRRDPRRQDRRRGLTRGRRRGRGRSVALRNATLLPGLIDLHSHQLGFGQAGSVVTTVRDLGTDDRNLPLQGSSPGPRRARRWPADHRAGRLSDPDPRPRRRARRPDPGGSAGVRALARRPRSGRDQGLAPVRVPVITFRDPARDRRGGARARSPRDRARRRGAWCADGAAWPASTSSRTCRAATSRS